MNPKDDPIFKHQSDQLDRALRDKYRALNTWAEIGSMTGADPDEDRRNQISGRLGIAEGMLEDAVNDRRSYSEVIDFVTDKILSIDPRNVLALTMRAIANSQLYRFADAVNDAEAAISAEPADDSRMGQWMRSQLPAWRESAERYGV